MALVVVNLAAGALGVWRWRRGELSRAFWPLLRAGQALVVLEALDGGVLLLLGEELPRLHLIYGLVPLGVSFIAEQLRADLGPGGARRARRRDARASCPRPTRTPPCSTSSCGKWV